MKILHVNCLTNGSTGKIINDIALYTSKLGLNHILCSPREDTENKLVKCYKTSVKYEQGLYRRINFFLGFRYGFAPISTLKILKVIKRENPDIVHIHCINCDMVNIYKLFSFLGKNKIPTVITNHAEFFYTGNCEHSYDCEKFKTGCGDCPNRNYATRSKLFDSSSFAWKKMYRAFHKLENAVVTSVSPWTNSRSMLSPITSDLPNITIINGVNTNIFTPLSCEYLRKKHNISEKTKIVFHATANFSAREDDLKGGRYIIRLAEQLKDENIVFIVAGPHGKISVPKNIILLGTISDQNELASYYSLADLTIITSKRETFSMPVAESLCCGTPIVGFKAGGPESITMPEFSEFFDNGNINALREGVLKWLSKPVDKTFISKSAQKKYTSAIMSEKYFIIYKNLLLK
ncbi:MAG: glycosyltransferase [Acutalibacteraceae bacterium]|nr:glycosyltransferase [Acutalibacteraceae bacterium]